MIIGFAGAAGSGKDTAAKVLIENLGFEKVSFATPLKEVLCQLFGWDISLWEDNDWKETPQAVAYGHSPRYLAQTLGTEWARNLVHGDFWCDQLIRHIKDQAVSPEGWVIPDVRFPNEAEAIRRAGGVLLYVECVDRATTTHLRYHESERWLPWLELFADCKLTAAFGEIEKLQEATQNVAENYIAGMPHFEPSKESVEALSRMYLQILADIGER